METVNLADPMELKKLIMNKENNKENEERETETNENLTEMNEVTSDVENNVETEEVAETNNKGPKSLKHTTGYQKFFQNAAGVLTSGELKPSLGEMSKAVAKSWEKLDDNTREDWNKAAQQEREERDCGMLVQKACESCGKSFELEKHLRYHIKRCGKVKCTICDKEFNSSILLKKHTKVHSSDNKCEVCGKNFVSKQSLERHGTTHTNERFSW